MAKLCLYCHNTGQAFYAVRDMKKGEEGWFGLTACTKCENGARVAKIYLDRMKNNSSIPEGMVIHADAADNG